MQIPARKRHNIKIIVCKRQIVYVTNCTIDFQAMTLSPIPDKRF